MHCKGLRQDSGDDGLLCWEIAEYFWLGLPLYGLPAQVPFGFLLIQLAGLGYFSDKKFQ